ncbi:MAG: hypothetical protein ACLF0G_02390 [Candidatus Brocadiia bacterium]
MWKGTRSSSRIKRAGLAALTVAVLAGGSASAGGTRAVREALQGLYVEPVAVAAGTERSPAVDGALDDAAWRGAEPLHFGFSDPTTPGRPRNTTTVRLACDERSLYLAFECKELRDIKAKATTDYDEEVPEDDHVSILLMPRGHRWCDVSHPNACILIKVNAKGAVWARRYRHLGGDARPGTPITVDGLGAGARIFPGRWAAEVQIPFASLFDDLGQVPAVWKANFFRKRTARLYDSVQPGDPGYANWTTSWKPSAALATFSLCPAMFGVLYVPAGEVVPPRVRAALAKPLQPGEQEREPAGREKPPPGFKISPAELEKRLDGPVAFVPHVEKGPEIRGDLSDPLWQKAQPLSLRYLDLYVPGEVEKNRTYVRLLADDDYLYIAYDCEEDFMDEIRAACHGVDPDGLWRDDCVDTLLDPGRTESYRYFYLAINPMGAHNTRRMKNNAAWEPPSLRLKTWRGKERWRAEARVAFEDLGVASGHFPRLWGANFFRIRYARRPTMDETPGWMNWDYAWRPNRIGTGHLPEMFGYLYFQQGDVVLPELVPYLASKGVRVREQRPRVEEPPPIEPAGPPPAFAAAPRVSREGGRTVVRFAAEAPTDVAVWVADAKGAVVRHLAAGILGEKAPPPLRPGTLEQTLVWDGRDDDGEALPEGTYTVHVALGLGARFERVIGWRPAVGTIRSLGVGPGGELYVCTGGVSVDHGWANSSIRAFDRQGRYLRQVYPFPGNLPVERMRGIRPIELGDGSWLPVIYNALNHSWLPESPALGTQQVAITGDGHILVANLCMRGMGHGRRLLKLGTDGSAPADLLGPQITRYSLGGEMFLALSPDEKWVYVVGLRGRSLWDPGEYHNVVYRVRWDGPELRRPFREPFIGEFQVAGDDPRYLSNPRGIAVDAEGNIVVADTGNHRLAVFRPDGAPLKQIPMPGANKVGVHRGTEALYVLCSERPERPEACALVKLRSLAAPAEVARLELPRWRRGALAMAIDDQADPPLLWLGNGARIADLGDRLELRGSLHDAQPRPPFAKEPAGLEANLMALNRATGTLYAGRWRLFDGATGRFLRRVKLSPPGSGNWGGEVAFGPQGTIYFAGNNGLFQLDASGKPLAFANGKRQVPELYRGHGNSNRGHCVAPNGDIYFVHHYHSHGNTQSTVSQVAPDGTVKRYQFIDNRYTSGSGVRVDRQGNVYVGMALKPFEQPYPRFFRGRLPTHATYPHPWFYYRQMYGSIVKFRPKGGRVVRDRSGDYLAANYSFFHRCRIEGAEWVHYGFCPMHQKDVESSRCNCESARFDLDAFGRLFIPDAMRASVEVIDANANPIARLGGYGNMDARGPKSPIPQPEVPLAWPLVVVATDEACYIADTINRRIVKARLTYEAEQQREVRVP